MQNRELKHSYHPDWNFVLKNTARYSIMAVALITLTPFFGQIASQAGPYYEKLIQLNEIIAHNPLGSYVLNTVKQFAYILSSGIPQYHLEDVPTVPIAQLVHTLAIIGSPVEHLIENAFTSKREKRKLDGIEPVKKNEKPKHVYIGPSQIASDLAKQKYEGMKKTKNPVVVVHTDREPKLPPRFGQEVGYHFHANGVGEILGTFPPSKKGTSFVEVVGIENAQELTFICVNPENAVHYGFTAESQISPSFVSSLIKKIPKRKLKGKTINVIMPQIKEIGGTAAIEEELRGLKNKFGFKLNIKTPEKILKEKIENRLLELNKWNQKKDIDVVILGQGEEEKDRLMLENFRKDLKSMNMKGKKVNVRVLKREEKKPEQSIKSLLDAADLVICYGDTDVGTTTLIRLLKGHYKINDNKIAAVIENIERQYDVDLNEENTFFIYQMILDSFS